VAEPAKNLGDKDTVRGIDNYWNWSEYERFLRQSNAALVLEYAKDGSSLLDVGCGTGLLYRELKRSDKVYSYAGIDSCQHMLDIFESRNPEIDTVNMDMNSLSFSDGSFDTVCCFEVLGHVKDVITPLKEMWKVARKNVIFSLWVNNTKEDRFIYEPGGPAKGFFQTRLSWETMAKTLSAVMGPTGSYTIRVSSDVRFVFILDKEVDGGFVAVRGTLGVSNLLGIIDNKK
jgi:ubiquinone/menaquinone biosynthesis C-methylase UbiE